MKTLHHTPHEVLEREMKYFETRSSENIFALSCTDSIRLQTILIARAMIRREVHTSEEWIDHHATVFRKYVERHVELSYALSENFDEALNTIECLLKKHSPPPRLVS